MLTASNAAENAVLIMQDILASPSGEYCHALQDKLCFTLGKEKTKTGESFVSATSSILPGPPELKNDLISETAKH